MRITPSNRADLRTGLSTVVALSCLALTAGAQTFTLVDYTGRGFTPDVVNYTVKLSKGEAEKLRLLDAAGAPVAFQVTAPDKAGPSTLSFVTDLPANSNVTFTLNRDSQGPLGASSLTVASEGDSLVLANALCAVKLPGPVEKTFKTAVAANTLPAPILAFRSGASGAWWGAGKVLSERKVTAWRVVTAAKGPAFSEVRYELDYEGGGYYRAVVRLADCVPMARVTEEYDLGRMETGRGVNAADPAQDWHTSSGVRPVEQDVWELDLARGWQPDAFEKAKAWGNGGGGDIGVYGALSDFKTSYLMNAGAYSPDQISVFGLFRTADTNAGPAYPGVGVTPLHNGFWRRAMGLELSRPSPSQVVLRLPMTRTTPVWVETSPFCVAPQDPDKPYTYARRQWGLVLGPLPVPIPAQYGNPTACRTYQARLTYGTVGLDRYKDYILDWPADEKIAYPRVFVKAGQIERYRAALTPDNPLTMPMTNRSCSLSGNRALAGPAVINYLIQGHDHLVLSAVEFAAQSHHACCDAGSVLAKAEDLLGCPDLPAEQRRALRTRLALLAPEFHVLATNLSATPPTNVYTDQAPVPGYAFYRIGAETR